MNPVHRQYLPNLGKHRQYIGIILLAVYFCTWFMDQMELYIHGDKNLADGLPGSHALIIAIGIALGAMSWHLGFLLAAGRRVLPAMQAPTSLWASWQRAIMRNLWLDWSLAIVAGSVVFLLKEKNASWSSALFLYSTIVTLCLAASLSKQRVAHRGWGWAIFFGVCTFLCIAGQDSYALLTHIPVYWQLPLSATWPLLACMLLHAWRMPPKKQAMAAPRENFIAAWTANHKRYAALGQRDRHAAPGVGIFWFIPLCVVFPIYSNELTEWGAGGGLLNIAIIIGFIPYAGNNIFCKDLHWRRLLMPDGFGEGRIGWNMFFSTALAYATVLLPLFLVFMSFAWLLSGMPPSVALAGIVHHSSMSFELIFATSVAIALRSFKRWWLIGTLLYLPLAVGSVLCVCFLGKDLMKPWFIIGPGYAASLLAASLAAILFANRIWTKERLLPFLVKGAQPKKIAVPRGRWFPRFGRYE